MLYQHLEIEPGVMRLIQILPPTDQPGLPDPIHCTLEHVSLDEDYFSEDYRTWISALGRPLQSADRSIWRADAIKLEDETNIPKFRYIWGDYMALSYTWGTSHDNCEIFVNGQSFQATKNLESALRGIRGHEAIRAGYRLWIDALCIDQKNMTERNREVTRMQEIYGMALDVIVWLGDEADDSKIALDFMNSLSGFWDDGKEYHLEQALRQQLGVCDAGLWKAFNNLTSRLYWYRLWVIQEQLMGTMKMLVLCGDRIVHWDDLYRALYYFNDPSKDRITSVIARVLEEMDSVSEALTQERLYWRWNNVIEIQDLRNRDPPPDTMVWMCFGRHKKASNPSDMIYGLLALVEPAVLARIKPDYNLPVRNVFAAFAKDWIIGTNSLEIFQHCDMTNTPSWSPDWTIPSFRCISSALEPRYQASGDSVAVVNFSADSSRLICKGLKIDTIDGLSVSLLLDDDRSPLDRKNLMFQSFNSVNAYGDEDALKSALWKTMVENRDLNGNSAPESYRCLFDAVSFTKDTIKRYCSPNATFLIAGRHLDHYFPQNPTRLDYSAQTFADAVERAERFGWSRRLVTTQMGFVGMVPEPSQKGDIVCIVLGCSFPVILRPEKELYRIVGACYIHGFMEGEAIRQQRMGEREFEDFIIE